MESFEFTAVFDGDIIVLTVHIEDTGRHQSMEEMQDEAQLLAEAEAAEHFGCAKKDVEVSG